MLILGIGITEGAQAVLFNAREWTKAYFALPDDRRFLSVYAESMLETLGLGEMLVKEDEGDGERHRVVLPQLPDFMRQNGTMAKSGFVAQRSSEVASAGVGL